MLASGSCAAAAAAGGWVWFGFDVLLLLLLLGIFHELVGDVMFAFLMDCSCQFLTMTSLADQTPLTTC